VEGAQSREPEKPENGDAGAKGPYRKKQYRHSILKKRFLTSAQKDTETDRLWT